MWKAILVASGLLFGTVTAQAAMPMPAAAPIAAAVNDAAPGIVQARYGDHYYNRGRHYGWYKHHPRRHGWYRHPGRW